CKTRQSVKKKVCKRCGEDFDKAKAAKRVNYWISYRLPSGKQKQEAVGDSIEDARAADGKKKSQKKEGRLFDIKADATMTFGELAKWYLELEKVKALASSWVIELSLRKFNDVFGDMIVSKIRPSDIENYQAMRLKAGKAPATVDHEVGKTRTMIMKAFDNDLVSGDTLRTFKKAKKTLKKGSDVRDRILTQDEFERLCQHAERHIREILTMAYYTGMRRGEILNLTWDKVDMKDCFINLDPEDTKDNEKRSIPICNELYDTLKSIPRNIRNRHVFTFRGKPIKNTKKGMRGACKKAKITYGRDVKGGFILHDCRHTFNTNMRRAGVAESVIMAITGHSTREMFDRYNVIDAQDKVDAVNRLEVFFQNVTQNVTLEAEAAE
ncbi:MAG: site-specific integrase, partial [Desulfobacteraceae bacterium]|nr:site-specific integrase [Desulfobacteraceae bacterium]